ncbi:collagen binding domain-containing protein [Corallococcus sp. 4LFB]|uniref:MSCRAMM family protein n=1 Tax=Corallococcus sp. 4LFB TaxID=3383249 RepID=UPI003974B3EF
MAPRFLPASPGSHRLSIAGLVVDAWTGQRLAHAEVTLAAGGTLQQTAWTAPDGAFRFADVPTGLHTLTARLPGAGQRYGTKELSLTVPEASWGTPVVVELALPTTSVSGRVVLEDPAARELPPLARVRVQGSDEQTFTDVKGDFLLTGLEPGKRTLRVTAPGYRPEPELLEVELELGRATQSRSVVLKLPGKQGPASRAVPGQDV